MRDDLLAGRLCRLHVRECTQQDGTTPLILALKEKREDLVDVVLASPIVNANLPDKTTTLYPLHMALIMRESYPCVCACECSVAYGPRGWCVEERRHETHTSR